MKELQTKKIDNKIIPDAAILGHPAIDTLHHEMTLRLETAIATSDSKLIIALTQLQLHSEHHFASEESLMTEQRFAGYNEHRHEHQQILAEFNSMINAVARGRYRLARAWLRERLPEWFRLHVANLDSLLVAFLKQRRE